jgi:hypothetical protein
MFHAGFCHSLGIKLYDGIKSDLGGIIGGKLAPIYFHKIKIMVAGEQIETVAGFSEALSVAGLLGRRGFFENFIVRIDASVPPPSFDVEKIHRA